MKSFAVDISHFTLSSRLNQVKKLENGLFAIVVDAHSNIIVLDVTKGIVMRRISTTLCSMRKDRTIDFTLLLCRKYGVMSKWGFALDELFCTLSSVALSESSSS